MGGAVGWSRVESGKATIKTLFRVAVSPKASITDLENLRHVSLGLGSVSDPYLPFGVLHGATQNLL